MPETAASRPAPRPITEVEVHDRAGFERDVVAAGEPAVLRGLVARWPAVAEAARSPAALVAYLARLDSGAPVDALLVPPAGGGRVFYNEAMDGFNYLRNRLPLAAVAEQVLRYAAFPAAPSVAVQSAPAESCVPGFTAEHPMPLLADGIAPRLWLGNRLMTPTHVDEWCNLACVVAGRRRFTLFPPAQVANLYVGPLDFAPTGAPMSLVDVRQPDLRRFPRFADALAAARVAELGPGDALYVPPLWWHNVESLADCNLLVNYWWHARTDRSGRSESGFDSLLLAILGVRGLPSATRAAWRALFEHYVFADPGAATEAVPPERHGVLAALSAEDAARVREVVAMRLRPGPAGPRS
ncbi:MAG: cupin-like domain-containing protein [Proteobacteria bacterium]|nr:cupin-like domain-containing protein [Pseudomonadota bacterium]